ncbi:MAG: hypothetical protein NZL91_06950, partial [Thermoflexales bacterium]|nr:hypothetical protein [Thermoflexales bacterium]
MEALQRLVALFVQCWNRRQLFEQAHLGYKSYPRDYASIWVWALSNFPRRFSDPSLQDRVIPS